MTRNRPKTAAATILVFAVAAAGCAVGNSAARVPRAAPGEAGIEWVRLPGGTFSMGPGLGQESPALRVAVGTFEIARTLVTNKQYKACMRAGACTAPNDKGPRFDGDDQPAIGLTWHQAKAFSAWVGGDLPTEAQWEYAARSAGKDRRFPWGNEDATCERGVFDGCAAATLPVCSRPKGNTDQGLCDMAGDAQEWTRDPQRSQLPPLSDGRYQLPLKENGIAMTRGSAWNEPAFSGLTTYRRDNDKLFTYFYFGLRPVRDELSRPVRYELPRPVRYGLPRPVRYGLPLGLKEPPEEPKDNPTTDAKIELGRLLFFDPRLSGDGTVSCATCHDPAKGWTDRAPTSTGIQGRKGTRSAPTILNAAYAPLLFWDGRATGLEEQALEPIKNPAEMGSSHAETVKRLSRIKGYAPYFKKAFGAETVDIDRAAKAIASFERTVLTGNSPYDRWQAGDDKAMSAAAVRGFAAFTSAWKGGCGLCHEGVNFSDSDFHNLGVGLRAPKPDLGRFAVTKYEQDHMVFKTPTLRNLADTAPYFHDGSKKTLKEVVEFYKQGGETNHWLSGRIGPIQLTPADVDDLVAFMDSLNGDKVLISAPELPK